MISMIYLYFPLDVPRRQIPNDNSKKRAQGSAAKNPVITHNNHTYPPLKAHFKRENKFVKNMKQAICQ